MTIFSAERPIDAVRVATDAARHAGAAKAQASHFVVRSYDGKLTASVAFASLLGSDAVNEAAAAAMKAWFRRFAAGFDLLVPTMFNVQLRRRRIIKEVLDAGLVWLRRGRKNQPTAADNPIAAYENHLLKLIAPHFTSGSQPSARVYHRVDARPFRRRAPLKNVELVVDAPDGTRIGDGDAQKTAFSPEERLPEEVRRWLDGIEILEARFDLPARSAHEQIRIAARFRDARAAANQTNDRLS